VSPVPGARGSPVSKPVFKPECAGAAIRWCRHRGVQPLPGSVVPPDHGSPFDNEIGLVFTELSPDGARAQLEVQPKLLQPMGIVHGGVYCSIIESMASVAAYTWLNANGSGGVVGVNNNTDFLRAIDAGTVYGTATPLHRGRRQQLWLVTITDATDRVVARGQVRLQNLEVPAEAASWPSPSHGAVPRPPAPPAARAGFGRTPAAR
jgi:1,4-dihydroxy-2-naphthoyl-CoA hydrolase